MSRFCKTSDHHWINFNPDRLNGPVLCFIFCLVIFCSVTTAKAQAKTNVRMRSVRAKVIAPVQQYPGTDVRGRVFNSSSRLPLVNAKVDLKLPGASQRLQVVKTTYTDYAGYYYFKGVMPNTYQVSINQMQFFTLTVVQIDYSTTQYQDVPAYFYK